MLSSPRVPDPSADCPVTAPGADGTVHVRGRSPSVVVQATTSPIAVSARALAPRGATTPVGTVTAASTGGLNLPPTAAGSWDVSLESAGPIGVCSTG